MKRTDTWKSLREDFTEAELWSAVIGAILYSYISSDDCIHLFINHSCIYFYGDNVCI